MQQFCALEGKQRFELMGFSFGARIVERLLFKFGNRVDRLWLFAPDGLETKWMFEVSMIPRPIRYFAHWILNRPKWLLDILGFLQKRRLINPFIYAFTVRHLARSVRRERLLSYWLSMDDFAISPVYYKSRLLGTGVRVDVFIGNRDEIVSLGAVESLANGVGNVFLHVVDGVHHLVNRDIVGLVAGLAHPIGVAN